MSLIEKLENLPIDEALHVGVRAQAEWFKGSLYFTAKYLLGYKDVNPRTHGRMIQVLEDKSLRKLIVMPRGTFKSSIGSVAYPIWRLINNPDLRILIDSELFSNSKNFLREIKAHLAQPKITEMFGAFASDPWNESEIIIKQRTRVLKEPSVACSGIGVQKTSQHYDLIIADDLNSPSNSGTPEGQQKVIDHYRYFTSLLEPGGTIVVIGTRYAANDIIGWILENEVKQPKGLL
jgi:hypothetical protein